MKNRVISQTATIFLVQVSAILVAMGANSTKAETDKPDAAFSKLEQRDQASKGLSAVFLGGSLTWGANASDPQKTSYRALMADWLRERYPRARWAFHDAAIGGTGSTLGLFRLERDVLAYDPDLVFLDFTINDGIRTAEPVKLATYEAILRALVQRGILVVVVTMGDRATANPSFDVSTLAGYQAHLKLAGAYGAPVGDALAALRSAAALDSQALARFYPFDGVHPDDSGYQVIFEGVRDGFEQAVRSGASLRIPEEPVFQPSVKSWKRVVLRETPIPAGWRTGPAFRTSMWFDGLSSRWMGDVVIAGGKTGSHNDAEEVPLKFEFDGTFVGVFGEADENGLGFRVWLDGKPVLYRPRKGDSSEIWPFDTSRNGQGRLLQYLVLADDLEPGRHTLEIRPVFSGEKPGGELRIESICAATITEP